MASEKQLNANRANAQLSSGPVTSQGKPICSLNTVKTGLTGQTVLLKTDDVEAYNQHIQRFNDKFQPANGDEHTFVQDLADTEWRLLRIAPLEAGIIALGRLEVASHFAEQKDPAVREALLDAKVFLTYRRDLTNLSLQQTRLRKHRASVTEELTKAQEDRKRQARIESHRAGDYYLDAIEEGWGFTPTDFGFVFTLDDMFEYLAHKRATDERDAHPQVTKKLYKQELRAQCTEKFGAENHVLNCVRTWPKQ